MMLLNNDYYLDLKTKVIAENLSAVINNQNIMIDSLVEHINNDSMHRQKVLSATIIQCDCDHTGSGSSTVSYKDTKLTEDTIKYLPINYTAAQLNDIIRNTPHNLNRIYIDFSICSS